MTPSLWRQELIHPFQVHLPIALLSISVLIRLASLLPFRNNPFLLQVSRFMLVIGVICAWGAIYTGGLAEGVVNRVICDPTITHLHEDWAWWTACGFTAVAFLEFILPRLFRTLPIKPKSLAALSVGVQIGSLICLLRTAHLGASLVYQQGAGVYHPSVECTEFD